MSAQPHDTQQLFAPGKLFVFGEWSVLEGSPALIGSTPAGQQGLLSARSDEAEPTFVFHSPAFSAQPRHWRWQEGRWCEQAPGEQVGAIDVVGCVLEVAAERLAPPKGQQTLEVSARGLFADKGRKYGVGSSGAIAALVAMALGQGAEPQRVLDVALEGHRQAQSGRGSGADVATSVLAGLSGQSTQILFELPDPPGLGAAPAGSRHPVARALPKSAPAALLAVWTGQSADTRQMMASMAQFKQAQPHLYRERMAQVAATAEAGIEAWQSDDASRLIEAVRHSADALEALGVDAKVSITIEAHRRLAAQVAEQVGAGAAVKPSGAGGGDMALVVAQSPQQARALGAYFQAQGYRSFGWIW